MTKKLIPKSGGDGSTGLSSITDLARKLRGEQTGGDETPQQSITRTEVPKVEPVVNSASTKDEEGDSLPIEELLAELKTRTYSCKETLYVDDDIKEVFTMLKIKGKIPISSLVSYILESWLTENEELVSSVLKNKNRFL